MSYALRGSDVPPTGGLETYGQPGYVPPTGGMYDYGSQPTQTGSGYRADDTDVTATDEQNAPGCNAALEDQRGYGDGRAGYSPETSCDQFAYDCGWNRAYGVQKPGCGGGGGPSTPPAPGTPNQPAPAPGAPSSAEDVAHGSLLDKTLPWIIGAAVLACGALLATAPKGAR